MIGGHDVIIPTTRGPEALNVAVRAAIALWPAAVIEDAVTGETFPPDERLDVAGRQEILVFRDAKSAELWETLGSDSRLRGTLIHFLLSGEELTVVVDASPPAPIEKFVEGLRQKLGEVSGASRR